MELYVVGARTGRAGGPEIPMQIDTLEHEALWRYYQRGYRCLVRSGLYFRRLVRPAMSHIYFQKAMPLFLEYARANRGAGDLPPGFGDQMQACRLTARDLLHLDYAISLGYSEAELQKPAGGGAAPIMEWPGPGGAAGIIVLADAILSAVIDSETEEWDGSEDQSDGEEGGETGPPFDL
ncbi:MAG TPA: hypothetical protein VGS41_01100 [Chthonomonadales bacterium]|nr:hypothetical protein [Chthonomonadales bacterium]